MVTGACTCDVVLLGCFRLFWDVVLGWNMDLQKRLLLFATGSDRVPVGGVSEMTFKLTKVTKLSM